MLQTLPPRPPYPTRLRTQLESFLVLRRNFLELWGQPAYELDVLPGKFLGRAQLMLNAPEAIRHVLVGNADNYQRNPQTRRVLQPILGGGLFLAEGEAWRHQRRTIAPALVPRTMPILAQHVVAASAAKEGELAALTHRPVELLPHLQHLALAIAGQSMFSLEMSGFAAELRGLLLSYGMRYAQPGILDMLLPESVPSVTDRGRAAFRDTWLAFLDRLISVRAAYPPATEPAARFVRPAVLRARSGDGRRLRSRPAARRGQHDDTGRPRDDRSHPVLVGVPGRPLPRAAGTPGP